MPLSGNDSMKVLSLAIWSTSLATPYVKRVVFNRPDRVPKGANPTGFRNELYELFLELLLTTGSIQTCALSVVPRSDKTGWLAREAAIRMLVNQELTPQGVQWALNNVLPPAQDTTVAERATWAEKRRAIRKKYKLLEPSRQQTPRITTIRLPPGKNANQRDVEHVAGYRPKFE